MWEIQIIIKVIPHDLITSLKYILSLSKDLIIEPGHKESTILKDEEEFIKNIVV